MNEAALALGSRFFGSWLLAFSRLTPGLTESHLSLVPQRLYWIELRSAQRRHQAADHADKQEHQG